MNDTGYKQRLSQTRVLPSVPLPPTKSLSLEDIYYDHQKHEEGNIALDVHLLKEHLKSEGKVDLGAAKTLAMKATDLFREENNLLNLKAPIRMFGDIHGQYFDLIKQTDNLPKPDVNDPWLFLGDYVDRGAFGVEVVLYLFSLKIQNPNAVYLIRGNHECRHLTTSYNFRKECLAKYKDEELYEAIMVAFDALPLGAIVDGGNGNSFLCVHGGLSPDIRTLQDIENLNRFGEPPQSGPICDLLWSDPLEDGTGMNLSPADMEEWYAVEYFENENRGAGYIFGYTAVMTFLKTNNLASIIRAHDVQRSGYCEQFMHTKEKRKFPLVITVFSAPNYCGYYGNEAAMLRMEYAAKLLPPTTNTQNNAMGVFSDDIANNSLPSVSDIINDSVSSDTTNSLPSVSDIINDTVSSDIINNSVTSDINYETMDGFLSDEYYPKLFYTQYNCVDEIPFNLPNFENGLQHSFPLVVEKLQNIMEYIRDMVPPEEDLIDIPITIIKDDQLPDGEKHSSSEAENISPKPEKPKGPLTPADYAERVKGYLANKPLSPVRDSNFLSNARKVADRIKAYESNRIIATNIVTSNALLRRKSIQALSGSFNHKMQSYLSVIKSPFDQIKFDHRASELRPPPVNV